MSNTAIGISRLQAIEDEEKEGEQTMSPPTTRSPVHVEFDFNNLHISGDLITGRDHSYNVDAVIDSRGKRHRLSTGESKAILRKIDALCEITNIDAKEAMHTKPHGLRGHLLSKAESPDRWRR